MLPRVLAPRSIAITTPFLTSLSFANSLPFTIFLSTLTHRCTTSHARQKAFVLTRFGLNIDESSLLSTTLDFVRFRYFDFLLFDILSFTAFDNHTLSP